MIKDSGERREFETGAVRDMQLGKGRCDLLPLDVVAPLVSPKYYKIFKLIEKFKDTGDTDMLYEAIIAFANVQYTDFYGYEVHSNATAMLELAKHFEEGADKYEENNWKKGLPTQCYIDSATRHLLKVVREDDDEAHDRAFLWNLICCIWTCEHKPELNNYKKETVE